MTRGTLFYYESDENVWSSTEFNGDMYHGTPEEPQGMGDEVIKLMCNLEELDDFKAVLQQINEHYEYEEGNECWSVSDKAIDKDIERNIKWVDEERPDLKGDNSIDPRAWDDKPTFKNVTTWHFWGTPNLSDYSYIYNNSGDTLNLITENGTMDIPDGALGVLCFGRNDCIYKNGKIYANFANDEGDEEDMEINTDKLKSDVWNDLQEKVNEVYLKYQERLYIKTGDINPLDHFKQDDIVDNLAQIITNVLISQM